MILHRKDKKISKSWSRKELIILFDRLESYTTSGLPLDKILQLLETGLPKGKIPYIQDIGTMVQNGQALSKAFGQKLRLKPVIVSLIRNGEMSGKLGESFSAIKQLLVKEDELISKCISAMIYPSIIGIFSILLTIALTRGVMPQIIPMLIGLRTDLPLMTKITIAFSDIITLYGLYILLILMVIIPTIIFIYKKITHIRKMVHHSLLKVPIVGNIISHYFLSVFLRSMGSLVESGLALSAVYREVINSITIIPLRIAFENENKRIMQGIPFSIILNDMTYIPRFVPSLVSAGEISGELAHSLLKSADIIDKDMDNTLKRLTAMLEPSMMIVMGFAVGAIALSIMMPVYNVSKALQH